MITITAQKISERLQGMAIWYFSTFFLIINIAFPQSLNAQEQEYDEIIVFFSVPRIGGADIPALIKDDEIYLSVIDVFNFLRIKVDYEAGFDQVNGFFLNPQSTYTIDRINNNITYNKKTTPIKPGDLIRTETTLYLKANYFGEVFDLNCSFNFRSLSVVLNTSVELPVIREMRLEQMRKNVGQIRGDIIADTSVGRKYPIFHFGMADWTATSTQIVNGKTDTRLSMTLGSVLLGGETNINLNYNPSAPFEKRDQYYYWRFVDNNFKYLRQTMAGKISADAVSTLNSSVIGVQFSNSPTTYRRSYGTYTLSDVTEPDWLVELYVNNVLVDYKRADASGFFSFDVPLIYGYTNVKLQFYGPWGEERSQEKSISVPFNFLPTGEFEYKATAGILEDSSSTRFSRVNFDYGLTGFMTIGAGVEYLSNLEAGNFMPFFSTSLRLAPSLLLSGEYMHGVRVKSVLNYRLPSDLQFEVNYTIYDKDQKAVNTSYLEERKISITAPIRTKKLTLFSRLALNQFITAQSEYTSAELMFSGPIMGINTNFTTNAVFSSFAKTDVYSNLSFSLRLPKGFILMPQTQFNYSDGRFVSVRGALEKRIKNRATVNMSYEQNFKSKFTSFEVGFRWDFKFAQTGINVRRGGGTTTFVETASGTIMADAKTKFIGTHLRPSVGKGGITIYPFLDLNANGVRDKGEPKVKGLNLNVSGGRVEHNERDTLIRIYDMEPYTTNLLTLFGSNFDNIAWQIKNKTMAVTVDPNQFKIVEVPIDVLGEVAGTVYLGAEGSERGQGRVIVNIYKRDSTLVSSTLTEEDGYFSYMGLRPGKYFAMIDTTQMRRLAMKATPGIIEFEIEESYEGDFVDGLEFYIEKLPVSENTSSETEEKTEVENVENTEENVKNAQEKLAEKSEVKSENSETANKKPGSTPGSENKSSSPATKPVTQQVPEPDYTSQS
ncbi:MAG: hypothetical protein Q8S23_09285 [Bacteroidales bacterium]|nr:hypothetical protein [Bacteroidales bacterium]